ncbi:MAG: hypothetical protein KUG53_03055 [Pseudomonadales bacterium]|nr:hypothetical protein [Pseudomonadales bacterium]
MKTNFLKLIPVLLIVILASGCASEQAQSDSYSAPAISMFDRAWSGAHSAFSDQGVKITRSDRNTGIIHGSRDEILLTATINQRADGSVEVKFKTSGKTSNDPDLINRVSQAYNRSMGH